MWTTFTTTVRTLLHTPSAVVWTLVFPIVLATVFNFMFEPLRAQESVEAIDVAVVDDDAWRASPFSQVIDALATQDEPPLRAIPVDSTKDARSLMKDGQADGAFSVQSNGEPLLVLAPTDTSGNSSHSINRAILQTVLTSYLQNQSLVANVAQSDPAALENASAIEAALSQTVDVAQVSLTRAQPDAMVRFYYALLGMASIFAAQLAEQSVWRLQPTASAEGARRAVSGTSRMRLLIPTIAGCWVVSTAFLAIAFGYICLTAHIDFAGREPLCLIGIAAASLLSCGLGALVGSLPGRMRSDSRRGLLTAVTCLLSLFAGLYGQPTMELADSVAKALPAVTWINPVCLVRDLFYSVYYYDALAPFALRIAAGTAMAAVFLAISVAFMRRYTHEHLYASNHHRAAPPALPRHLHRLSLRNGRPAYGRDGHRASPRALIRVFSGRHRAGRPRRLAHFTRASRRP